MLTYTKLVDGIYLVNSDYKFPWQCHAILIKDIDDSGNILIDANFIRKDQRQLLKCLDYKVEAYFATHTHLDHINRVHIFEKLMPDVNIYCPAPEHEIMLDINNFIEINGALDFGVGESMKEMIYSFMGFKEIKKVIGFTPGDKFEYGNTILDTIPLPGHSPGHFAMIIKHKNEKHRKILLASDMGLEEFGPWYGFKYNNIKTIRGEVKVMEDIYLQDDFILVSSHGTLLYDKKPEIFKEILKKIDIHGEKLFKMLDSQTPKGLNDLLLKGVIYNPKTIMKHAKANKTMEGLWKFWEGGFLLNHLYEWEAQEKVIELTKNPNLFEKKWILAPHNSAP